MKNILTSVMPTNTLMFGINAFYNSVLEKGTDYINDFQNGVDGKYYPFGAGIIKAEDFKNVLDNSIDVNTATITCYLDGSEQQVSFKDVCTQIGNEIIAADAFKTCLTSIADSSTNRINDGSAALRTVLAAKYGFLDQNMSSYVDSLCSILESNSDKMGKIRSLLKFNKTEYVLGTGFRSEAAAITGINPWVAFFCGPLPDFSSVSRAVVHLYTISWRIVYKFYQSVGECIGKFFNGATEWFNRQVNPYDLVPVKNFEDYSLDTCFISKNIPYSDWSSNEYFVDLIKYLYEHNNTILCIPTLGATWYFKPGTDVSEGYQNGGIIVYIKKHVYNYEASRALRLLSGLSYTGSVDEYVQQWDNACCNITDLSPMIDEDGNNENDLFNGLIQAEALIPLGISLISSNHTEIRQTLSKYNDGTIDSDINRFKSSNYSYSTKYTGQVTNLNWKAEYEYHTDNQLFYNYLVNTVMRYVCMGIVYGDDTSTFIPYLWTTGQLTGCARIKTDDLNVQQVESIMTRITAIIAVATVVVVVGVAYSKLRAKAFAAQRAADLAAYDTTKNDAEVRQLAFKARMLNSMCGLAGQNTVNLGTTLMSNYSDIKATQTSEANTASNILASEGSINSNTNTKTNSVSDLVKEAISLIK